MTTAGGGVDLLLVEDNPDDAQYVERLVHEYQAARDVDGNEAPIEIAAIDHVDRLADAVDRVREDPPDAILLDLMLPDSRGLETVERTVEHAPGVPIVVLTGRDEVDVGVEAIQRGAEDYLTKGSVTGELILRTLRYALERTRHRRELVDRNHRLALLNRIIRQDLRNDVSMIVGLGDQLRSRVGSDDEAAVETLLEAGRHVAELADTAAEVVDVLSSNDLEREPRDLHAALEAAVTRLRREREVDLRVDRRDAGDGPVVVYASPMLESVFDHLLANAVDHSDRRPPRVTVTVDATSDRATVAIADDGVGIPDDRKRLLVDPDARFDDRSGMGVGLYLVTTLLESFGGDLEIDDNYPRGTVVTVALERAREA